MCSPIVQAPTRNHTNGPWLVDMAAAADATRAVQAIMYDILMDPRPPNGRPQTHRRPHSATPRAVKPSPAHRVAPPEHAGLEWAFGANRVTSRGIRFQRPAHETRLSGRVNTADSSLKKPCVEKKTTLLPSGTLKTPHEGSMTSAVADALAEAARCRSEVAHALQDCEERLLQLFKVDDVRIQAKTILVCVHTATWVVTCCMPAHLHPAAEHRVCTRYARGALCALNTLGFVGGGKPLSRSPGDRDGGLGAGGARLTSRACRECRAAVPRPLVASRRSGRLVRYPSRNPSPAAQHRAGKFYEALPHAGYACIGDRGEG